MGEQAKGALVTEGVRLADDSWKRWHLTAIWAAAMGAVCLVPASVGNRLAGLGNSVPFFDKLVHAGGFGVLAFLARRTLAAGAGGHRAWLTSIEVSAGVMVYSIGLEMCQRYVSGRAFDPGDITANLVGVLAAMVVWHLVGARKH